jgi:hypothetical protein
MTREGLALIGIPQDLVLKHNCPRLIYGVRLATNAFEYLRGEAVKPTYVFSSRDSRRGTREIVEFWLWRWLRPRAQREESLAKIEASSPDALRVSREIFPDGTGTVVGERQEVRDARVS